LRGADGTHANANSDGYSNSDCDPDSNAVRDADT
jgi:hypothetical protein